MNNSLNRDMLLYTTEQCNLDCSYCYNDINIEKAKMSDVDLYNNLKSFVEYLIENNFIDKIMLSGGEPLMWSQLGKFINDFKHKKKIAVFTNGINIKQNIELFKEGIDIKLSLHGLVSNNRKTHYYKSIIHSLEDNDINYGLIYLISKQNFHRFFEDYKELRSESKSRRFSLKFQPIIIPRNNQKFIRGDNPVSVIAEHTKTFEEHSLHGLSENDWNNFRDNILRVIDYEESIKEELPGTSINESVYKIGDKNLEYWELLKNYYLHGMPVTECDTGPIIVVGSDGNLYQCMFLFDNKIGNIHEMISEESKHKVLEILKTQGVDSIKHAKCFSEECIGALRPV